MSVNNAAGIVGGQAQADGVNISTKWGKHFLIDYNGLQFCKILHKFEFESKDSSKYLINQE